MGIAICVIWGIGIVCIWIMERLRPRNIWYPAWVSIVGTLLTLSLHNVLILSKSDK